MTRKEFERRINTYVEPYIMKIAVTEINNKAKDLECTMIFMRIVVRMLEMARDSIFDCTSDADEATIARYLDGIMVCWSNVIPKVLKDCKYESEESREYSEDLFNICGIQMQAIIERAKKAITL